MHTSLAQLTFDERLLLVSHLRHAGTRMLLKQDVRVVRGPCEQDYIVAVSIDP